ncbi:unnamed protein product [Urochloa humidicola]
MGAAASSSPHPPLEAASDPPTPPPQTAVPPAQEDSQHPEEQAECGFCLFMKGGGCREEFTAWEKCVEEAEAATGGVDVVERCQDITAALRKCMDAHADYYEPILRAERAMAADLEAFQAQEAAAASEEGQKKQAADAAAPSEEDQKKQAAETAVSEEESRDPAA